MEGLNYTTKEKQKLNETTNDFILERLENENNLNKNKKHKTVTKQINDKFKVGIADDDLKDLFFSQKDIEIVEAYKIGFKDGIAYDLFNKLEVPKKECERLLKDDDKNNKESTPKKFNAVEEYTKIENIFKNNIHDIETFYIKRNPDLKFNEYYKIADDITEYLEKQNVDSEILKNINEMLQEMEYSADDEMRFWEYIFFREGINFYKNIIEDFDEISKNVIMSELFRKDKK